MTQRRYSESEVAAIFQRASESPPPGASAGAASAAEGLTLAQLQDIGRDVGIPADAIALAAQSVDVAAPQTSRTFLGFPIGVSHAVPLSRRLTDEEWERVVVDLRETFDAKGHLTSHGSLRQWTNGNLQVMLEPAADGSHRIRLRTVKGNAPGMLSGGLAMMAGSGVMLTVATMLSALGDTGMVTAMTFLGVMGAGMFGLGALPLPDWARTRRRQMEEVARRAAGMAAQPVLPSPGASQE